MTNRGRRPKLSAADQHELRRYREAGVSIAHLASMWRISKTTVFEILADQRAKFGPEIVHETRRRRVRLNLRRSAEVGPLEVKP
jgi:hypothetical protein